MITLNLNDIEWWFMIFSKVWLRTVMFVVIDWGYVLACKDRTSEPGKWSISYFFRHETMLAAQVRNFQTFLLPGYKSTYVRTSIYVNCIDLYLLAKNSLGCKLGRPSSTYGSSADSSTEPPHTGPGTWPFSAAPAAWVRWPRLTKEPRCGWNYAHVLAWIRNSQQD